MINKELLSEVINKKIVVDDISNIELKENTITFIEDYWDEDEGSGFYRSHTINIYELAHLCKEWAISKGFITHSVRNLKEYVVYLSGDFREPSDDFRCNSEPEAIFKACQWILDNVKTNSLS